MTKSTSLAVSLAVAATVIFAGLIFYFTGPTRAGHHHPLTPERIFWMAFSVFGMITMLAFLFHTKPHPTGLKIAVLAYLLPAGVILPLYHFAQISVWFGLGIFAIWAIVITWRTRTKEGWNGWWADW